MAFIFSYNFFNFLLIFQEPANLYYYQVYLNFQHFNRLLNGYKVAKNDTFSQTLKLNQKFQKKKK